jgi:hypothetical protein
MSKAVGEIALGAGLVALDLLAPGVGMHLGPQLSGLLKGAGSSQILSGLGTLLSKQRQGFQSLLKNPVTPRNVVYGRARVNGTLVFLETTGVSNEYLHMVFVLASHPCQSVDNLLFDGIPVLFGLGTSNVMFQDAANDTVVNTTQVCAPIATIGRSNNVVSGTVALVGVINSIGEPQNFPIMGQVPVKIKGVTGDTTLNGEFTIRQIDNFHFEYDCPGPDSVGVVDPTTHNDPSDEWIMGTMGTGQMISLFPNFADTVHVEILRGNQTAATFAGLTGSGDTGSQGLWTNQHLLRDCCAIYVRLKHTGTIYASGIPNISFLMHGKNNVYDPRSGAHDYTENPALCIADYLNSAKFGFNCAYGSEIPENELIGAANICDEPVLLANGVSEARYSCNGAFHADLSRAEILQNLLTSCAGKITANGGQYIIRPGAFAGESLVVGADSVTAGIAGVPFNAFSIGVDPAPFISSETFKAFDLRWWVTSFSRPNIASAVSLDNDTVQLKLGWADCDQLHQFVFYTLDGKDHPFFKFSACSNLANTVLELTIGFDQHIIPYDQPFGLTLTIETADGASHYIRCWNYMTSGSPTNASFRFDFNNLRTGIDINSPGFQIVDPTNIVAIFLTFTHPEFGNKVKLDDYAYSTVTIRQGANTGNLVVFKAQPPAWGIQMTLDYDDLYDQNPYRIVRQIVGLGYSGNCTVYIGMSHFYRVGWIASENRFRYSLKDLPWNDASLAWLKDLYQRLKAVGIRMIFSMSYELLTLYAPLEWCQYDATGAISQTGWVPPSSLLAFTRTDVMAHFKNAAAQTLSVCDPGDEKWFQIGEPWWWDGSFSAAHLPCFYDSTTKALYQAQYGQAMYNFASLNDPITDPNAIRTAQFLNAQLGQSTNAISAHVKSHASNVKTGVLFFTPQAFGSGVTRAVNYPEAYWVKPNYDFFQIETYDEVTAGAIALQNDQVSELRSRLGYSLSELHYFAGFVLFPAQASTDWPLIYQGVAYAYLQGIANIAIWSYSQIVRDGVVVQFLNLYSALRDMTGPFQWKAKGSITELYNGCKGTYISPKDNWQTTDFPAYCQDARHGFSNGPAASQYDALLAQDGGDRRWMEIELPFTISCSMAQRLAKIALLRTRFAGMATLQYNMTLYQITAGDVMSLTLEYMGWRNKLFEVLAHRLTVTKDSLGSGGALLLGTEIDLQETSSGIYSWTPFEELSSLAYPQTVVSPAATPVDQLTGL